MTDTYGETVTDIEEHLGLLSGYLEALPEGALVNERPNPKRFLFGKGEIDLVRERDCVPRTYAAGESFLDPGEVHNATDTSDAGCARAYAMFRRHPRRRTRDGVGPAGRVLDGSALPSAASLVTYSGLSAEPSKASRRSPSVIWATVQTACFASCNRARLGGSPVCGNRAS